MRPVYLEMNGFASFREQARVDFADADFFALVGPTGSGKSTVIDAMTFALYGSVPRWGRKGMVSLALAPTVARGTVKLVFEVEGQRYVAVRELRRSGSQVNQKAASLERLLDPAGQASPGDPTAPMAKDLAGVNEAVEGLLGLSFEDFCQCVVLPQGQFASFLHAKPADRDQILLRLLGAEHYKQMMMKANQRAAEAAHKAAAIGETLLGYADATGAAESQARAASAALESLAGRVAGALPRVAEAQRELAAAEDSLRHVRAEHSALLAVRVPDGIAGLDARLAAAAAGLERRRDAEDTAEATDTEAQDALAQGPQRGPLERIRDQRLELSAAEARVPGLDSESSRLDARSADATTAVAGAERDLEELRGRRDEAARQAEAARQQADRLAVEQARLTNVAVPGGIAALDERQAAAASAFAAADAALEEAERADGAARAARGAALPEAPLAQVARDLGELRSLAPGLEAARHAAAQASATQEAAERELADASAERDARQQAVDDANRANIAAGLRPHLVAGQPCPVCEQVVVTLPAAGHAPEAEAAKARLQEADRRLGDARSSARQAGQAAARADAGLSATVASQAVLLGSLSTVLGGPLSTAPLPSARAVAATGQTPVSPESSVPPATFTSPISSVPALSTSPVTPAAPMTPLAMPVTSVTIDGKLLTRAVAEVEAVGRERAGIDQAAESAAAAMAAARGRHRQAADHVARADAELDGARTALRAARDPLVELGAPQVDDANVAAGWQALAQWAAEQAGARAAALAGARESATTATGEHRGAAAAFAAGERSLARLRAESKEAVDASSQAAARLQQMRTRVAELTGQLRDAPDEDQVGRQLALLTRLEEEAAQARQAFRTAREERARAEQALAGVRRDEAAERGRLSAARDRVVALGAPAIDARGLLDAWTELATWAAAQARQRDQGIDAASGAVAMASTTIGELTGGLSAELAAAGIEVAPDLVATRAAAAVTGAIERARAAIARIAERRAQAAELAGRQQAEQERQQVARLLGDLLQANRFQRWLVAEAMDDLVETASRTLLQLSGGQFDLAHDESDFYVIDHADVDSRRSVRTLSGGETFQASLALALALSSQISALAAAGAARLDSIFLDEGFGTLDHETLDVVAATLETLAQGDRMVGVVTHVQALAERVPVRFRVVRNPRTSTIIREGVTAPEEEVVS